MGAVIDSGYMWLAVLTVINSAVSLVYYLRVLGPAYLGGTGEPRPVMGRLVGIAVATATLAVVGVGVFAQPLISAWQTLGLVSG